MLLRVNAVKFSKDISSGFGRWRLAPDGKLVASGSDDSVGIWHLATGEYRVLSSNERVWAVAFNSEGNILASGGFDTHYSFMGCGYRVMF